MSTCSDQISSHYVVFQLGESTFPSVGLDIIRNVDFGYNPHVLKCFKRLKTNKIQLCDVNRR